MKQMAEIQGGDKYNKTVNVNDVETHAAIRKENAQPGVPHVRLVEKRIIGQRCAPTKMKTRKDSPKHVRHTILNNRMRFRIKSATIESVR